MKKPVSRLLRYALALGALISVPLAADPLKGFIADVFCGVDASSELILSKICNTQSALELILPKALSSLDLVEDQYNPNLISNFDKLCIIDQQTLFTTTKLDALQPVATSILDKVCQCQEELSLADQALASANSSLPVIESILDEIAPKACTITSELETLNSFLLCNHTAVFAPTTISTSGAYCLANSINGNIIITADDVLLDLNSFSITNALGNAVSVTTANRVAIQNGSVLNSPVGISVFGAQDTTLKNIIAQANNFGLFVDSSSGLSITDCTASNNLNVGISVSGVQSGSITNCTMNTNTSYGLRLIDQSHGLCISQCTARANGLAGFALEECTNNSFMACKAFGNGIQSSTDGFGFVSTNGSGNMFSDCLADSTQTTTTNFCTVAAGFALLGTEQCSKIVDCSACNAFSPYITGIIGTGTQTQTAVYSALPCGILLESISSKTLIQIASIAPGGSTSASIRSVNWSGDGKYLAVGGTIGSSTSNDLFVYQFDPSSSTPLIEIASIAPGGSTSNSIRPVKWSPDGKYLAVGGAIFGIPGNDLRVYQFDPSSSTVLVQIASINPGGGSISDFITSVNWSPDGKHLAVGGQIFGAPDNDLIVYQFDPASSAPLVQIASIAPGSIGDVVYSVNWSPDGKYLAVGGQIFGAPGNDLIVYQFDPASSAPLIEIASIAPGSTGDTIFSVNWSPDGKYLAVGGDISGNVLIVYQFDPASSTPLLQAASGLTNDSILSINWSPDGTYLAVGGTIGGIPGNDLIVYQFDQNFPTKNFIQNNTATCNMTTSTLCPRGTGISGSSIQNCIIGNTAYNNPFNYTFVTNTFTQLLSGNTIPSPLQNISLIGCAPICTPQNINTILNGIQQITSPLLPSLEKSCAIQSILDAGTIASLPSNLAQTATNLSIIESLINYPCAPTILSTGTTISIAGSYCLAQTVTNQIAITASNVFLDLNGYAVSSTSTTGAITVAANAINVNISNGLVTAPSGSGVLLNTGAASAHLYSLTAYNSVTGILADGAIDSTIERCDCSFNTTGIQLTSARSISIIQCAANNNSLAGFSLASSGTNALRSCKALNNGSGSTTDGFGFVSANGANNIFSNCAADATQTATTNFANVAAGFALLGTEQCSIITDCTSCTASAPFSTSLLGTQTQTKSARPHGIYLEPRITSTMLFELNVGNTDFNFLSVEWSPDGKYLAAGGNGTDLKLYQFDSSGVPTVLTPLNTGTTNALGFAIRSISWSPDGNYIALVGDSGTGILRLYQFNPNTTPAIRQLNTGVGTFPANTNFWSVEWSPNGQYLLVAGLTPADDLYIYQFNPCACTSPALTQLPITGVSTSLNLEAAQWSPDGNYVAIGGPGSVLGIYQFNPLGSPSVLTALSTPAIGGNISALSWSSDGKYFAVAGSGIITGGNNLAVYQFDPTATPVLQELNISGNNYPTFIISLDWSGDGQYLAITGQIDTPTTSDVRILKFNPSLQPSPVLSQVADNGGDLGVLFGIRWSPDGRFVAAGGNGLTVNDLRIYSTLQFPTKNYIQNNTVSCNAIGSASYPVGVGICGSSIANCIIGNTAYNNLLNYPFVPNIFTQLLSGNSIPSAVQNVALNGLQPICIPSQLGQDTACVLGLSCGIESKLDFILTKTRFL